MENKTYTSSTGEKVDVQSINAFQLVNALIKYAHLAQAGMDDGTAKENVAVLKEETLRRLDTRVSA